MSTIFYIHCTCIWNRTVNFSWTDLQIAQTITKQCQFNYFEELKKVKIWKRAISVHSSAICREKGYMFLINVLAFRLLSKFDKLFICRLTIHPSIREQFVYKTTSKPYVLSFNKRFGHSVWHKQKKSDQETLTDWSSYEQVAGHLM